MMSRKQSERWVKVEMSSAIRWSGLSMARLAFSS